MTFFNRATACDAVPAQVSVMRLCLCVCVFVSVTSWYCVERVAWMESVFSISRLCYDVSIRLSVRLTVCDVCALWSQGAMDPGYLSMLGQMDVFATY